jgi:hypothetical protein
MRFFGERPFRVLSSLDASTALSTSEESTKKSSYRLCSAQAKKVAKKSSRKVI